MLTRPSPVIPANKIRLLVAEDNAVNQRVILLQLKKLGHHADIANNGIEVLQALERTTYGSVFMDCQMSEMDGYETTHAIRNNKRFYNQRIVAMTANATQGDREKCLAAGMDDYPSIPSRIEDLKRIRSTATTNGHHAAPGTQRAV